MVEYRNKFESKMNENTVYIQSNPLHETMKINSALRDRKIQLSGEITTESVFETMYFMDRIKSIDEIEGLPICDRKPIEILIDSCGGSVYDGLTLISKIKTFQKMGYIIITTATGIAMSMGSAISLTGSIRQSYMYTRFMFHQPSSVAWGTLRDMKRSTKETE